MIKELIKRTEQSAADPLCSAIISSLCQPESGPSTVQPLQRICRGLLMLRHQGASVLARLLQTGLTASSCECTAAAAREQGRAWLHQACRVSLSSASACMFGSAMSSAHTSTAHTPWPLQAQEQWQEPLPSMHSSQQHMSSLSARRLKARRAMQHSQGAPLFLRVSPAYPCIAFTHCLQRLSCTGHGLVLSQPHNA